MELDIETKKEMIEWMKQAIKEMEKGIKDEEKESACVFPQDIMDCEYIAKRTFKKIKEEEKEKKPKFRVWDYAVVDIANATDYIKINSIVIIEGGICTYDSYKEDKLRKPTQAELIKYFR